MRGFDFIQRDRVGVRGSARVSRVGDGVLAIANFSGVCHYFGRASAREKIVLARRQNQHARRVRYPDYLGEREVRA
jgi:hypothetical protein